MYFVMEIVLIQMKYFLQHQLRPTNYIVDWNINEQDNKKEFSDYTELKNIPIFQNPNIFLKIEMTTKS